MQKTEEFLAKKLKIVLLLILIMYLPFLIFLRIHTHQDSVGWSLIFLLIVAVLSCINLIYQTSVNTSTNTGPDSTKNNK